MQFINTRRSPVSRAVSNDCQTSSASLTSVIPAMRTYHSIGLVANWYWDTKGTVTEGSDPPGGQRQSKITFPLFGGNWSWVDNWFDEESQNPLVPQAQVLMGQQSNKGISSDSGPTPPLSMYIWRDSRPEFHPNTRILSMHDGNIKIHLVLADAIEVEGDVLTLKYAQTDYGLGYQRSTLFPIQQHQRSWKFINQRAK